MLEQLIESKNNTKEAANRLGFLSTTFILVAGTCLSGILWSLFAMNLAVGDGEFDLTALLAPVAAVDNKPEPIQKQENQTDKNASDTPTRQANMLRTDEISSIVPDTISVVPNTQKARPVGNFDIGPFDKTGIQRQGSFNENSDGGNSIGQAIKPNVNENNDNEIPDLKKPDTKPKPPRSIGVVNSKATYLPKPAYPLPAKAVGASGAVNVQVTIDESGRVTSAKALSGHSLLLNAAEGAARNARFTPTLLNNQPVKVTGIIIYNFVRN